MTALRAGDPISAAVARYASLQSQAGVSRSLLEDQSSALFIDVDRKISAHLWVLDTIITAAPLLGLLGTILGIMETFTALAKGGISDPGEVAGVSAWRSRQPRSVSRPRCLVSWATISSIGAHTCSPKTSRRSCCA